MLDHLSQMTGGDILLASLGTLIGVSLLCFVAVSLQKRKPGSGERPAREFPEPVVRDFLIQTAVFLALTVVLIFAWRSFARAESPPEGMVLIPQGAFTLGSTEEDITWAAQTFHSESLDYYLDETPAHRVTLPAFYLDRTEVTVARYQKFLDETGKAAPKYFDSKKFNGGDQPAVGVDWQDASDYCAWTGKRLPTEVEWEKAARGTDARFYPWGTEPDPKKANVRGMDDGVRYTAPVGHFPEGASPYGVLDLAGNAWEWTDTWYGPHPGNAMESDLFGEKFRVIKGGSWFSNLDLARASVRGKALPTQRQNYIGFRCALSAAGG